MEWIKIDTGLFTDEKIQLLRCEKNGDELVNIWIQLLCLAGRQDNDGVFMLTESKPYTPEQLSSVTGRDRKRFIAALELYQSLGMIDIDNGCVTICNWGKHQGESVTRDAFRKTNSERQKRYRERQRNVTRNVTHNVTEEKSLRYVTQTEEEEEKEIEEDNLSSMMIDNGSNVTRNAAKRVMDVWPNLPQSAIEQLQSFMEDLPDEVIVYALEQTQLKPGAGFRYFKAILDSCLERNLKTLDAINQAEADRKATKSRQAGTGKADLNYQQHAYTDNDFNESFYYDPSRDFLPGGTT